MHVLHNFFQVERKHNFLLGPIHPLSPTSNELHGITKHVDFLILWVLASLGKAF